jgi:hypothetical protein
MSYSKNYISPADFPYYCAECNEGFGSKGSWANHRTIHRLSAENMSNVGASHQFQSGQEQLQQQEDSDEQTNSSMEDSTSEADDTAELAEEEISVIRRNVRKAYDGKISLSKRDLMNFLEESDDDDDESSKSDENEEEADSDSDSTDENHALGKQSLHFLKEMMRMVSLGKLHLTRNMFREIVNGLETTLQ